MHRFFVTTAIGAALLLSACDAVQDAQSDAADNMMGSLVEDQIEVYEIAKKNGDKMQTCVQAMGIAQGFLQAKDEESWKAWKVKEKEDCAAAGMPSL
jgi:hypothetical protein